MQSSTYLKFIAGSVPDHSQGLVDDSLRLMAQEATGANEVHYLRSPNPVGGHYHYLAVPSVALANEPDPATELAMALPGHPQHQGPGIYVLDVGQYKVAVIFDGQQMDLVCNEAGLVLDFLSDQSLPLVQIPPTAEKWRLASAATKRNQLVESLSRKVVAYSLIALAVFSVAGTGLVGAEKWLSAKVAQNNELTAEALTTALKSIQVGSPLSRQLADYQKKSAVAVRAGGWVDSYLVTGGKESFRFFVPSWITEDYMKALGAGVAADRDAADEQLLVLTKGEPVGGRYLSSADTVAKTEAEVAAKNSGPNYGPNGAPPSPPRAR